MKREVAIKVLPAYLSRDPDRIGRFEREARSAGSLNHPNIVAVYEFGRDDGTYWIATELVAGESLAGMIERGHPSVARVVEIAIQITEGLTAAHSAGIVRRDLKPANIMVTRQGRVKILDFGLALRRHSSQNSTTIDMTGEGKVMGTCGYMSPEQVRGEGVDHRSDLFSFGVVLYEMCSGRRAFCGASPVEVMNAVLKEQPAELPASVPSALAQIVRRCMEKEPERRFQSAADLGFALHVSSPSSPPAATPKRRVGLKRAGLAAASVVAASAMLFWFGRPEPPPRIVATVQITNDGRPKGVPLFTDGSRVLYRSRSTAGTEWSQVGVRGGESMALPLPFKNAVLVDVSPDRTELLLCRIVKSYATPCELFVAPLLGGSPRRLGDLVAQNAAAAWSPDGQQLIYAKDQEFHIARSDGTEVRKLVSFSGTPFRVRWSPDGSRVRFSVGTMNGGSLLWDMPIGGTHASRLLPGWTEASKARCGIWTPDGKYFYLRG